MRVVVAGQGWLAARTALLVDALLHTGFPGAAIEVAPTKGDSGEDTWMPSLRKLAQKHGWTAHARVEASDTTAEDVVLSLQYDRIIRCDELNGARAYNLHFAPLPRYRGSLTSALTVRNGEVETAVTLHDLVQGVDAGGIIAARVFDVPPFYSSYDLYTAYHRHGFELIREHAPALLAGPVPSVEQDDSQATAFSRRAIDFGAADLRDFDRPAVEVRNWCLSLVFPPSQCPTWRDRPIGSCYVLDFVGDRPRPGTVVRDSADLALVACSDGLVALEFIADGDRRASQGLG